MHSHFYSFACYHKLPFFPEAKLSSTFLSPIFWGVILTPKFFKANLKVCRRQKRFVSNSSSFQRNWTWPQILLYRTNLLALGFSPNDPVSSRPTRDNSNIITQCTTIKFIRLLLPTTLLPRGETLFHLHLINILEIFKDFSSTTRKYSKNFHQQPENIQRLFINNPKIFKDFFACRIVLAADHRNPGNIQGLSNQQQQAASSIPAASSNQQEVYQFNYQLVKVKHKKFTTS